MNRARRGLLPALLLLGAGGLAAATLAQRVQAALEATPVARGALWGIQAVDLASGKTLCELNANRFFVPASNTKLFTTALALTTLGADATFHTRVLAATAPDANGLLKGSLRLLGGGDPNLSPRAIPYDKSAAAGDPLIAIDDLADQVAAKGVKRITGNIIGDDSLYVWQPYADGWSVDDPSTKDGTAVSALAINDIGGIRLKTAKPLVFDGYATNRLTGSFILIEQGTNATVAAGMLSAPTEAVTPEYADFAI